MARYLITLVFCFYSFLYAGDIIHIASSNHPLATAYNNSRKLVRTLDDRLVVVYQDSIQAQSVIMWLYSDGLNWSEPRQLAPGSFPALTIAENNQIYAAWQLEEQNGIGLAVLNPGETVWHDGTDILYGQNTEGEFLRPPVPISEKGSIRKSNPSIGYKMFRWDIFDIIWTEGDRAPYKIIYKRHKKDYDLKVSGSPVADVRHFELEQNYPNPFNQATSIPLFVFQPQMLKAEIYDLQGRLCKTLAATYFTEGRHTLPWDGTDNSGLPVSSGFYVLLIKNDSETNKIKLLCLK
jgi:hypothetical protein